MLELPASAIAEKPLRDAQRLDVPYCRHPVSG